KFQTKSRFGCTACKRRRVKCDGCQPTCGGCAKLRSNCQYLYPYPSRSPEPEPEQSTQQVAEDRSVSQPKPLFDLLDLALMYHYTTSTCQHLFTGDRQIYVWQDYIPTLGRSNGVLMHGILAVTALHQAHQSANERGTYRTRALHHHGMGLPIFKAMVASASTETAEVIVAYAILLGIWVYGAPAITSEQLSFDEILDTVEIGRTGRSVFRLYRDVVITTPIGLLLNPTYGEPPQGSQVSCSLPEAMEISYNQVEHDAEK
ncbi:hypothetical protein BU23DRAFT_637780, partial [Bimuria novae-zelandiae CBS 107.79]